jgi:hypothetical protein
LIFHRGDGFVGRLIVWEHGSLSLISLA